LSGYAGLRPVVALDIDGTLGDYHGHFLRFAEGWTGKPMPDPSLNTAGVPLYQWMKVSKATYRECKLAYRQGGLKRSMPCYEGAADGVRSLRKSGVDVWIATTRPYLRLDNIDPDTRHWLRRNKIQYDGLIYGDHKYRLLKRLVGERVLFVVDDLPSLVAQASSIGLQAVLRQQPYNLSWEALPNAVARIDNVRAETMLHLLEEFR
jgi:hypothetical protein